MSGFEDDAIVSPSFGQRARNAQPPHDVDFSKIVVDVDRRTPTLIHEDPGYRSPGRTPLTTSAARKFCPFGWRARPTPVRCEVAKATYQLYVDRIGREPAPMTADYGEIAKSELAAQLELVPLSDRLPTLSPAG